MILFTIWFYIYWRFIQYVSNQICILINTGFKLVVLIRGVQLTLTLMSVSVFSLTWAWAWAACAHAHMSAHERERFWLGERGNVPDHFFQLYSPKIDIDDFYTWGPPQGSKKNFFPESFRSSYRFIGPCVLISNIIFFLKINRKIRKIWSSLWEA